MKRQTIAIGIVLLILGWSIPGRAQSIRRLSVSEARGDRQIASLELHQGHSITLNFRYLNEFVRRIWLDNPSQVTLDFDDPGCAALGAPGECAATMIHLRRIHPLNFPNLSPTEATILTVLTDQALYKFRLSFPQSGSPTYYTVEVVPDATVAVTPESAAQPGSFSNIQHIERGLAIAHSRNLIAEQDELWNRLQRFLNAVRQGVSIPDASQQAGVSQALIHRLAELGQTTH
jgi:hypothetical protein